MLISVILVVITLSSTHLVITEPVDGEYYNFGESLNVRAMAEVIYEMPDSVHYSLNAEPVVQIQRLNTDWYTFMGNDCRTGYSESPAPYDNNVLWTAPVTGEGTEVCTPVIVNGIVYYPSNSGTDSLYALDAVTGDLIWKFRIGLSDDPVSIYDGLLYVAGDAIFCIDAIEGVEIWSTWGPNVSGGTPVVAGDYVYCGTLCIAYCLLRSTGEIVWEIPLPNFQRSCMTVWNDIVLVPTSNLYNPASLYALDATSGTVLWEYTSLKGFWRSSPVMVDSILYINGMDGYSRAIDVLTGSPVWLTYITPYGDILPTPAYNDGCLYFSSFSSAYYYYCLDSNSGSINWNVPGFSAGSSCIADGCVYYCETYNPNNARLIALDCETGAELWSFPTNNTIMQSSPAIVDGVIYFAGQDWNLYAIGTRLRYTYYGDGLIGVIGENELIATAFSDGIPSAVDTISFFINELQVEHSDNQWSGSSSIMDLQTVPNPFISSASILFTLSEPGLTIVEIFDVSGRTVCVMLSEEYSAGEHSIQWDGRNQNGEPISAGLYLCRIQSGGVAETTALCLLR